MKAAASAPNCPLGNRGEDRPQKRGPGLGVSPSTAKGRESHVIQGEKLQTVTGKWLDVAPAWPSGENPPELCPVSATSGHRVKQVTLSNHLRPEHWQWAWKEGFHFCPAPTCPIVYFHTGLKVYFTQEEIRTPVGIKTSAPPVPVCYCMSVTEAQIVEEIQVKRCCDSLEDIKQYTKARTGKLCHVTNPAGKCCGKHVTAVVERALAGISDLALGEQARAICCQIPED